MAGILYEVTALKTKTKDKKSRMLVCSREDKQPFANVTQLIDTYHTLRQLQDTDEELKQFFDPTGSYFNINYLYPTGWSSGGTIQVNNLGAPPRVLRVMVDEYTEGLIQLMPSAFAIIKIPNNTFE